jgi:hypothetical protein
MLAAISLVQLLVGQRRLGRRGMASEPDGAMAGGGQPA